MQGMYVMSAEPQTGKTVVIYDAQGAVRASFVVP